MVERGLKAQPHQLKVVRARTRQVARALLSWGLLEGALRRGAADNILQLAGQPLQACHMGFWVWDSCRAGRDWLWTPASLHSVIARLPHTLRAAARSVRGLLVGWLLMQGGPFSVLSFLSCVLIILESRE
ncbi:hypothetical protein Daesc_010027 [Daldinia eschscholtzii]|uniref:Uncharacterized protein n=1 Tax=Daldinia eschscholtzii TaxID=292717 RepID=A0AAX6M735_9PEZI